MTTQINLLDALSYRSARFPVRAALVAISLLVACYLAYGGYAYYGNYRTGQDFQRAARQRALQQAEIEALKKEVELIKRKNSEVVAKELQLVKIALEKKTTLEKLLGALPREMTERRPSYVEHLRTLSRISTAGVWITELSIANGGKAIEIRGVALSKAAAMDYARAAEGGFTPLGLEFSDIDIGAAQDKVQGMQGMQGGQGAPPVFEFKLKGMAEKS